MDGKGKELSDIKDQRCEYIRERMEKKFKMKFNKGCENNNNGSENIEHGGHRLSSPAG